MINDAKPVKSIIKTPMANTMSVVYTSLTQHFVHRVQPTFGFDIRLDYLGFAWLRHFDFSSHVHASIAVGKTYRNSIQAKFVMFFWRISPISEKDINACKDLCNQNRQRVKRRSVGLWQLCFGFQIVSCLQSLVDRVFFVRTPSIQPLLYLVL